METSSQQNAVCSGGKGGVAGGVIDGSSVKQPSLKYFRIDSCGFFARKCNSDNAMVQTAVEAGMCCGV